MATTLSYAEDLTGGFDVISKRAETGLHTCRLVHKFLKKRAKAEENYLKSLEKAVSKPYPYDEAGTLGQGFSSLIEFARAESAALRKKSEELNKIFHNVGALTKDMELKTKQFIADGHRYAQDLKRDAIDPLKKAHDRYDKSRMEVENEMGRESEYSQPDKFAHKMSKMEAHAVSCEEEYKIAIGVANELQIIYHSERLPKLLKDMERLDKSRIHFLKSNIYTFTTTITTALPLEGEIQTLKRVVQAVDNNIDIQNFIADYKQPKKPPTQYRFEPYVSPAAAKGANPVYKAPKTLRFAKSKQKELSKTAVFGVTLDDIMAKQKDAFPNLEVPRIQTFLQEALLQLGGHVSEGIFRVPGGVNEVATLKASIDDGNYALGTGEAVDVRVIAGLLKLWIRELPESIIPPFVYDVAVKNPETSQAEVLSKLPAINMKVLTSLINFLQVFCNPEFVAKSKMGISNLSMVFAPAILRCPHDDMIAFQNVAQEMKFVEALIAELPPNPALYVHLPKDACISGSDLSVPVIIETRDRSNTEDILIGSDKSPHNSALYGSPPRIGTHMQGDVSPPPVVATVATGKVSPTPTAIASGKVSPTPPATTTATTSATTTAASPSGSTWSARTPSVILPHPSAGGWVATTSHAKGRGEGWLKVRPNTDGSSSTHTAVVQLDKR